VNNTGELMGENVAGYLEGTDKKEEVVIITAHYDHLGKKDSLVYYGADDDGSGTSAVMVLAIIFS
jgi:Zn-dependent M28 family amino/carboxypeptidase